ncbi:hypothetical protein AKJ09_07657 [Labilithrix luteola]|uniref:Tetratricopeptide repeat protein n=1 Tax=Labilithrix luteola TaxID=1391654 RepID=A0A0K1Q5J5_9BACT|nr:hypothetical protein [Labilithrix luteola]AKV00994.1 hypothetical protein AKJ09_07657 [Labilithrix luteola]
MTRVCRFVSSAAVIVTALVAVPQTSFADPGDRAAAAEDLFQRGKSRMTEGNFTAACPLLAESYRLDPAGGTLQNLAICYESLGKWATAYARFQELRTLSKNAERPRLDRVKLAEEHIEKLGPRLTRIVVVMEDHGAQEVDVDGVTYQKASWSTGIAADPGSHELVVRGNGKQPFHSTVQIGQTGGEQRVVVPALADEVLVAGPVTPPSAEQPAANADDSVAATRKRHTIGYVVGGVGVAVLAAGAVFGVLTITTNAKAKDKCSRDTNPGANATEFDASGRCFVDSDPWKDSNAMKDDARTFANIANVLVPVGVVGLGVGAWLALTKSNSSQPAKGASIRISPSLGGASLEGTF